jgi:DNA invertase Pin-like site-specific DNA recombinase
LTAQHAAFRRWFQPDRAAFLRRKFAGSSYQLVAMAVLVGAGAGLAAVAFRWLITAATLFFSGTGDYSVVQGDRAHPWLPWLGSLFVVLAPVAGGLLYGPLVQRFAPEARGHGVPEVMYAVSQHKSYSCINPESRIPRTEMTSTMLIGYARVSTADQNLALQRDALNAAGCRKIYTDTISGAKTSRPGLDKALEHLRDGDTLVVWKLDRLGRSVKNLIAFTDQLESAGIGFRSLTDQIDTTTPAGRFFFHVMASLAQMERELTIERTQAGLAAARAQGKLSGRKRIMTDSKITSAKRLLAQGTPAVDVARDLGVSVPTLYRWLPASER